MTGDQGSPLVVMSSGSAEPGLDSVAAAYHVATGRRVAVTYNAELASPDVIVASEDALSRKYAPAGRITGPQVTVGQIAIGAGIRRGMVLPDLSSVASLTKVLLTAERILLTHNHSSGIYMEQVFTRLGLSKEVTPKISRYENGPVTVKALLAGTGDDLAFLSVNEFLVFKGRGAVVAGLLPKQVQRLREMRAVVASTAADPEAAREFLRFCEVRGRAILRGYGFL